MKPKILRLCLIIFLLVLTVSGCNKDEALVQEEGRKAENYIGSYTGSLLRERLAPNGFVIDTNAFVEKIPTEIEITRSSLGDDFLMVCVSAYNDSILCEFDKYTGYIWIRDTAYSFYLRTREFPEFDGIYYHAVSTYGNQGFWETQQVVTLGFDFLKDLNDSIYLCETITQKLN